MDVSGLAVVDIADPVTPVLEGTCDTPGNAQDVFVSGSFAYIADGNGGLRIVDVSDPSLPTEVGSVDTPGNAQELIVRDHYAYVAHAETNGLRIIDVQNPRAPSETGFYPTPKGAYGVALAGTTAYIAAGDIEIADISDPASPRYAGFITPSLYNLVYDVQIEGHFAYLAESDRTDDGEIRILDISDSAHPAVLSRTSTHGCATKIALAGDHAFIVNRYFTTSADSGLAIVDIADRHNPALINLYATYARVIDIAVSGSYAYAPARAGLFVLDVSDPQNPFQSGFCPLPYFGTSISISGQYAFLVYGGHLMIVDIEQPSSPKYVGECSMSVNSSYYWDWDVFTVGGLAYLTVGNSGLRIIDVSDPLHPYEIGSSFQGKTCRGIAVQDHFAYVGWQEEVVSRPPKSGLFVFDVTFPRTPQLIGQAECSEASRIALSGNCAIMASGDVVDVSDKSRPQVSSRLYGGLGGEDIAVAGNIACVIGWRYGLKIYNLSDMRYPHEDYFNPSPGHTSGVCLSGDIAFVSDEMGGVLISATQSDQPAVLHVTSPNGGESWVIGSNQLIRWEKRTAGPARAVQISRLNFDNVKIDYSTDAGATWTTISDSTGDTGMYEWSIPNTPWPSCLVRVTELANTANFDVSDAVFTIVGIPFINLNRNKLFFGEAKGKARTSPQSVFVSNQRPGAMAWTAIPSDSWIQANPGQGGGAAAVSISVDASALGEGTYAGSVSIVVPGASNSPRRLDVVLRVYDDGATAGPIGFFDTPVEGLTGIEGSLPVTGWALDDIEVVKVEIWRDPVPGETAGPYGYIYIGDAVFVEGVRSDVEQAFSSSPLNSRAGWGYMILTNFLPNQGNGTFRLHALAQDKEGHTTLLGSKTITCNNAQAILPFGAIDTPAQGGNASGADFINAGWALTPPPAMIPADGTTITVWVDGQALGHPFYNYYRVDIATLFPGYANRLGAIGIFHLDTTGFTNGVHTIAWSVRDDAGKESGIGSRYFTIFNPAGQTSGQDFLFTLSGLVTAGLSRSRQPLFFRKGFDLHEPAQRIDPEKDGVVRLVIGETERVEIRLLRSSEENSLGGYILVGDAEFRPLPIGSRLDQTNGTFTWQPGPGFIGDYDFVFVQKTDQTVIRISIRIRPLTSPNGPGST